MTQTPIFTDKDLKLKLPFGCVVAGPSSSGKSAFIRKLIDNAQELIDPPPRSILYCYGEYNSLVSEFQKYATIDLYAGVPSDEMIKRQPKPALIILDDLLYSVDPKQLSELFTKKAHHNNLGLIFVAQDVFDRKIKVARQNSQYIVLTRAPSSALSIRNLGTQLFPGQLQFFMDAYKQATRDQYTHLFIDLHPTSDSALRLRSNIFRENGEHTSIYIPRGNAL